MWDKVKPITLVLNQKNSDDTRFVYHFYSFDSELIKLNEAFHFNKNNKLIGSYSYSSKQNHKYNSNYFVSRISKTTIKKLIEYFENSNLYIEYLI